MMKICKNDKVKIMSGKDRGRESVVERVFVDDNKILVKDVNMVTKHLKKSAQNPEAGRVKIAKPVNIANVMLLCSKCGKPTRIGIKTVEGKNVRSCKKCGETV